MLLARSIMAGLMLVCAAAVCHAAPANGQPSAMPQSASAAQTPEQAELSKLTAENQLADQKLKKKLQQISEEKEELRQRYDLLLQKQKSMLADLSTELDRVSTANKLADEQTKQQLALQSAELARISMSNKLMDEKAKTTIAEITQQVARLKAENDLRTEQQRTQMLTNMQEKDRIDLEIRRLELKERTLRYEKAALDSRLDKIRGDLDLRDKKEEWKKESNTEPVYTDKPFSGGRLVISDRRIALNGPIMFGVASYVTDRIHYFNNISTAPVFIVIDSCPGGSVQEGYRIVKAMQASKAPVYVVVKSMAASMAAVITTMADKSFVYPNAIIMHHQMSSALWGNMTQMKEQLEMRNEWEKRLHLPVAKKMGISLDELRKRMYQKNSDGNWEEFGDRAAALKWATSVVDEIEETGMTKNPDAEKKEEAKPVRRIIVGSSYSLDEQKDEKGVRFVALPRLDPYDFYFIYNPDQYYR